ncbi:MAG: hypothetical protein U1F30_14990 [Steroidobacteraceae bacterium]
MHALVDPLVVRSSWTFQQPVKAGSAAQALEAWLASIAACCPSPAGHVIGHIKACASLPAGGCIQGNVTSTRQPPHLELHEPAGTPLTRLDVTLNVLVVGLDREAAWRSARAVLDDVAARCGFTHSTSMLQSQGEH